MNGNGRYTYEEFAAKMGWEAEDPIYQEEEPEFYSRAKSNGPGADERAETEYVRP
jgi:hypothetical protein